MLKAFYNITFISLFLAGLCTLGVYLAQDAAEGRTTNTVNCTVTITTESDGTVVNKEVGECK